MIRMRFKHSNGMLYMFFVGLMMLIIAFFAYRVNSGCEITEMSIGQTILISKNYELGEVYDRNGNIIAYGEDGEIRWSDAGTAYKSILGTNIEETLCSKTSVLGNCPWVFGTEDKRLTLDGLLHPLAKRQAGSVKLTLDSDLQEYVGTLISDYENAYVIVSNYITGEMLAISGEDVMGSMLHPGSTLKPILAAIALSLNPTYENYTYDCVSPNHNFMTDEGCVRINCAYQTSHGPINMNNAIAYSCNGFFISLLQEVGKDEMLKGLKEWGFDTIVEYDQFEYWDHSFIKNSSSEIDYLMAAIGQANAFISPAGLHFCTSALFNNGVQAQPIWFSEKKPTSVSEWETLAVKETKILCSPEIAEQVVKMMGNVTAYGTGSGFYIPGFAAKTGTAERVDETGKLTGEYTVWTTGGLVDETSPYSVTVCLDRVTNQEANRDAGLIARNILVFLTKGEDNYE